MTNVHILCELEDLIHGCVMKRPSATCKTPYVADISLQNDSSETSILGHTPALGCCGLVDKDAIVLLGKKKEQKKSVTSHIVYLSRFTNTFTEKTTYVGVHPGLAETIAENALSLNLLSRLPNVQSYKRQVKHLNSRFDFAGIDRDGKPFVLEVKCVPLCKPKEFKSHKASHTPNSSVELTTRAYFPDGYRKKKDEPVSPRALKHVQELQIMATQHNHRALLCFVILRSDATTFEINEHDPIYKSAVDEAIANGVEIITLQVHWTESGIAYFVTDSLPFYQCGNV